MIVASLVSIGLSLVSLFLWYKTSGRVIRRYQNTKIVVGEYKYNSLFLYLFLFILAVGLTLIVVGVIL